MEETNDKSSSSSPSQSSPTPPPTPSTPPPTPYELEKRWAETLGMPFDEERVEKMQQSTPPPVPGNDPEPPTPENPYYGNPHRDTPPAPHEEQPSVEPMPSTYLVWAVIATVVCCLPAGIVAIIFSSRVSSCYFSGDIEGARKNSERAQWWIIISIVLGVVGGALYLPFTLLL